MAESALDRIQKLAKEARDQAGIALSKERLTEQQLSDQIEMLQNYRTDYQVQLQNAMKEPMATNTLQYYNDFLKSLSKTIETAKIQLEQQSVNVERSREFWKEKQRRLSSFQTLNERKKQQAYAAEQRRERLFNDEINTNASARKTLG